LSARILGLGVGFQSCDDVAEAGADLLVHLNEAVFACCSGLGE
jgi:hypothetical protein